MQTGFSDGSAVKTLGAMKTACNVGDMDSTPGSGKSLGEGNILAWEIPWAEEPGSLPGHKESDMTE